MPARQKETDFTQQAEHENDNNPVRPKHLNEVVLGLEAVPASWTMEAEGDGPRAALTLYLNEPD
jgi:hypothetical protein